MRIGVIARRDLPEAVKLAGDITEFLTKKGVEVFLDASTVAELKKWDDLGTEIERMDVDLIISVGGDGTILRTQKFINGKDIPLFGINMGTVGFLTEIEPENTFSAIEEVLRGNYFVEKRMQLGVWHEGELPPALNEVVIMTKKPAKMLHLKITVDDEIAEELRADGLIIATPSGSTAYAMSAGGPIVDPRVGAFIIAPICPFKLDARPIVVPNESRIKVKLLRKGRKAVAVIDGQFEEEINYMDEIIFKKSDTCAYFARLTKDFYKRVREKLTKGGISL